MTHGNFTLAEHDLVAIGRPALMALRAAALRDSSDESAIALREAGYAGGEQLFAAFTAWSAKRGGAAPETSGIEIFKRMASEFFGEIGWGTIDVAPMDDTVVSVDTTDWWEADPRQDMVEPACHFTTGLLAYFFGRVADAPIAVLEVECRSTGAERCRFLLGSPDVLRYIFEELERGKGYEEALARV